MAKLFDISKPQDDEDKDTLRPHPLTKQEWPPNYDSVYLWRVKMLKKLYSSVELQLSAKAYYSKHPKEFIMDWLDTYDPRKSPKNSDINLRGEKWMPFVFFEKQSDVIDFFESCSDCQESGLVEKCRDFGLTWLACGYSVWRWLFIKDDAVGWGSRKETLVDRPGDPDSIFEKMRLMIRRLPKIWLPKDFVWGRHSTFMKLMNPENGAVIAGEAGDNIGRGGRRSIYFLDEAAHIEHPEKVEASLGDNTNVRIDISSVNGVGNVFHRRRENGVVWEKGLDIPKGYVRVFIADWRDHPLKTQEWYDARKARYEREGMSHIFAQEVDRNYTAAVSNVIIPYDWICAAVDAHLKVPYFAEAYKQHENEYIAGLDVADEGIDKNALTIREWVIWRKIYEWGERDTGLTARRTLDYLRQLADHVPCEYDSVGVGSGVKTEYNRLVEEELVKASDYPFIPWNAGAAVVRPYETIIPDDNESLKNKDFFDNLKAQAWWSLRTRFYKTYKAVTEGVVYPADDLISLDSTMPLLEKLKKELAQPTKGQSSRLKMLVEKKPNGMKSPNLADSGVMAFFPVGESDNCDFVGNYGFTRN